MNIKKRFIGIGLIVILSAFFVLSMISPVFAATNPYYYHDCTWTVWQICHDRFGLDLPAWGYADNWYAYASGDGYAVGQTPAVNSIICWQGHVGFVAQVEGNRIYVQQGGQDMYEGDPNWYNEVWFTANSPSGSGKAFIGYIYLGDIPSSGNTDVRGDDSSQSQPSQKTDRTESETTINKVNENSEKNDSGELPKEALESNTTEVRARRLAQLKDLEEQKKTLQESIEVLDGELLSLNTELLDKQNIYKTRLRGLYMSGGAGSLIEWLFTSDNIGDFFYKVEQVSKVIAQDKAMIDDLNHTMTDITEAKKQLKEQQEQLEQIHI